MEQRGGTKEGRRGRRGKSQVTGIPNCTHREKNETRPNYELWDEEGREKRGGEEGVCEVRAVAGPKWRASNNHFTS